MNLKKRIISGVMAGVLALSMAVPAFASTTTVTGTYQAITIAVDVPASTTAQINPYGMPVDLKSGTGDDALKLGTISGQQVSTQPIYMINKTTVPLSVGATVTTTVKGGLTLVADSTKVTGKTKASFVYLQMKQTTNVGETEVMKITNNSGNTEIEKYELDWATDQANGSNGLGKLAKEFTTWNDEYSSKDLVLSTSDTGAKGEDMIVLAAAKAQDATGTSGQAGYVPAHDAVMKGGIGIARISGVLSESPTEAWAASDGFVAKIAFTFKPANTKATVKASTGSNTAIASTGNSVFEVALPEGITVSDAATYSWSLDDDCDFAEIDKNGGSSAVDDQATVKIVPTTGFATATATSGKLTVTVVNNGITYTGSIAITKGT